MLNLASQSRPDLPIARDPRKPDKQADAQPAGDAERLEASGDGSERQPERLPPPVLHENCPVLPARARLGCVFVASRADISRMPYALHRLAAGSYDLLLDG